MLSPSMACSAGVVFLNLDDEEADLTSNLDHSFADGEKEKVKMNGHRTDAVDERPKLNGHGVREANGHHSEEDDEEEEQGFEEEWDFRTVAKKSAVAAACEDANARRLVSAEEQLDHLLAMTRITLRDASITSSEDLSDVLVDTRARWLNDVLSSQASVVRTPVEGPRVATVRVRGAVQLALEDERLLSQDLPGSVAELWRSLSDAEITKLSEDFAGAYERAAFEAGERALVDSGVVPLVLRETILPEAENMSKDDLPLFELLPSPSDSEYSGLSLDADLGDVQMVPDGHGHVGADEIEVFGLKRVLLQSRATPTANFLHILEVANVGGKECNVAVELHAAHRHGGHAHAAGHSENGHSTEVTRPPHIIRILKPNLDMSKLFSRMEDKFANGTASKAGLSPKRRGRPPTGRPRGRPPGSGKKQRMLAALQSQSASHKRSLNGLFGLNRRGRRSLSATGLSP